MVMTQATGNLAPCQKMVQSVKTMELASMIINAPGVPGRMIPQKVGIPTRKWT